MSLRKQSTHCIGEVSSADVLNRSTNIDKLQFLLDSGDYAADGRGVPAAEREPGFVWSRSSLPFSDDIAQ